MQLRFSVLDSSEKHVVSSSDFRSFLRKLYREHFSKNKKILNKLSAVYLANSQKQKDNEIKNRSISRRRNWT